MNPAPTASALEDLASDVARLGDDLDAVEAELQSGAASSVAAITDIGQHLRSSGGKRIRALLVLFAARFADCPQPMRVRLGAVVEMIHAATLIHDDILDDARTRRGRPSANAVWGNSRCVLAGDWLYMQAFRLAVDQRNFEILDALISLTQDMVEGELLQLEMQGTVVSAAQHLDLIERKTARLFQVASQLGAMAAGRPESTVAALGRFGRHLGLAFQMVDDLLDFTAAESVLGKPVGGDLRDGKMTLPAIYAHAAASAGDRTTLERALAGEAVPWPEIYEVVERTGALERARREGREQADLALAAISALPESPWQAALARLPALVIERDR